jgi:hypothetical protein
MPDRRELYRSPNGESWVPGREPRVYLAQCADALATGEKHACHASGVRVDVGTCGARSGRG